MKRVLGLVGLLMLVFLTPAPAIEPVTWQPTGMSPNWINEDRAVDITYEVESEIAQSDVPVRVQISSSPLLGRSEIANALKQKSNVSFTEVKSSRLDAIAGISAWRIRVPARAFVGLRTGIYVIQITADFQTNQKTSQFLLPILRNQSEIKNVPVSILWEVSAAPVTISNGKFLNSELANQFISGSAVDSAVSALAGRAGITVLVDPATVVDAKRISAGGSYLDGLDFSSETQTAATAWLAKLQSNLVGKNFYYLPYAGADINGLWFKNQDGLAAAVTTTLDLDTSEMPLAMGTAVIPARGDFSTGVWQKHGAELPELRILSSKRYPASSNTYTPAGVVQTLAGTNSLVFDKSASDIFTYALSEKSGVISRQGLLAESLFVALERPNESRVLVLKPNLSKANINLESINRTLDSLVVPWIEPISAGTALDTTATSDRVRNSDRLTPVFKQQTLRNLWSINPVERSYSPVISGSIHGAELWAAMARTVSANHPNRSTETKIATAAYNFSQNLRKSIRIVSTGSVAFANESGVVPITIENNFTVPVSVKLKTTGIPSVRVVPSALDVITIEPGKRKSIEIPTVLRGSDVGYLEIQVSSLSDTELGDAVRIQLASSAYSKIASYVVYGAVALLLILIVNNNLKRFRKPKVKP